MIPYYSKHGAKQYIRGKLIRFRFKLWCLTDHNGFMIHGKSYCGSSSNITTLGFGQDGDVVIGLATRCNLSPETPFFGQFIYQCKFARRTAEKRYWRYCF